MASGEIFALKISCLSFPAVLPTATVSFLSTSKMTGPSVQPFSPPKSASVFLASESRFGNEPHCQSSCPPYCVGMPAGSMKEESVGVTSEAERMKILEVVTGSNQRLIQPQTVGKKYGAPIIYSG